jgi:hypothetical protein
MQVLVFVTDDARSPQGSGPILVVQARPEAVLPPHPRALEWRYFATMETDDTFFGRGRGLMKLALSSGRPFITNRLAR